MSALTQIKDLWRYCFSDSDAYVDWFFAHWFREENTLYTMREGAVVAALQMLPYHLRLRGEAYGAGYIVGVSTAPEARGAGLASALLRESLSAMREKGWALSPLYPFNYAYYQKFGWRATCNSQKLTYPLSLRVETPEGFAIERLRAEDASRVLACYGRWTEGRALAMIRDEEVMRRKIDEVLTLGGHAYAWRREGTLRGFMLYYLNEAEIEAQELVYDDLRCLRHMLAFLGGHASTAKTAKLTLPADAPLQAMLPDTRGRIALDQHAMLRIVDLRLLRITGDGLVLRVYDGQAPWNDGVFALRDGFTPSEEMPDAEVDIGTLCQIISGYISSWEAEALGGLRAAAPGILSRMADIWPKSAPCILDMY